MPLRLLVDRKGRLSLPALTFISFLPDKGNPLLSDSGQSPCCGVKSAKPASTCEALDASKAGSDIIPLLRGFPLRGISPRSIPAVIGMECSVSPGAFAIGSCHSSKADSPIC